jgi:transposase InsO family protein
MTDNGSVYKSFAYRDLLADKGIRHKRTKPYTPRTNGKAERFIRTSLREWAYANAYQTSAEHTGALAPWVDRYNSQRTHSGIGHRTPLQQAEQPTRLRQITRASQDRQGRSLLLGH